MLGKNHLDNIFSEVIVRTRLFASAKPSTIDDCIKFHSRVVLQLDCCNQAVTQRDLFTLGNQHLIISFIRYYYSLTVKTSEFELVDVLQTKPTKINQTKPNLRNLTLIKKFPGRHNRTSRKLHVQEQMPQLQTQNFCFFMMTAEKPTPWSRKKIMRKF